MLLVALAGLCWCAAGCGSAAMAPAGPEPGEFPDVDATIAAALRAIDATERAQATAVAVAAAPTASASSPEPDPTRDGAALVGAGDRRPADPEDLRRRWEHTAGHFHAGAQRRSGSRSVAGRRGHRHAGSRGNCNAGPQRRGHRHAGPDALGRAGPGGPGARGRAGGVGDDRRRRRWDDHPHHGLPGPAPGGRGALHLPGGRAGGRGMRRRGHGVTRDIETVDENPERRRAAVAPDCPPGDYFILVTLTAADGVELASDIVRLAVPP